MCQQRLRSWLIKRRAGEVLVVVLVLLLTAVGSFWWIHAQESNFSQQLLDPLDAEPLISWELSRQLRIMVVVLSTAIAIVRFTENKKISRSTLVFCLVLAFINIISISRFVQSFQLVMHLENLLYGSPMYSHIGPKLENVYIWFFYKDGVLKDLGQVLVGLAIALASLLWVYLLLEGRPIEEEKQEDTAKKQDTKKKPVKKRVSE